MRGNSRSLAVLASAASLLLSVAFCDEVRATSDFHHGVIYYSPIQGNDQITSLVAERFDLGVIGSLAYGQDAQTIKNSSPNFQWFVYNSVTDNYVSGLPDNLVEDASIATVAARHGWNHEEAYLHFYDDTTVKLQGQTLFIPGWGGGSATVESEARVPVYYANLSRRAVNFSTPRAKQLNKEVIVGLALDTPFTGATNLYADGIFLDNSANRLWNYGEILSGGHVAETPGHLLIGSATFQTWHWSSNLGPFLTALKDTLETSASWSRDGKRKSSMINVSNSWTDSFVSMDVADVIFTEFQYDPIRNSGLGEVQLAWQRDVLAANAGIRTFYAPLMTKKVSGRAATLSHGEALLGSLAWHLTTRTEQSIEFLFGDVTSPRTAGWDTLTWHGCVDVVNNQLGTVVGDPYVLAQGTDPVGYPYKVTARNYTNGLVLVRNRGRWDEGIEPETAVSVPLPASLASVEPSGAIGAPVSAFSMRNGTGAIFLQNVTVSPPVAAFTGTPTSGAAPLTVVFTDQSTNNPTSWSWDFGDGGAAITRNPSHVYAGAGTYTVTLTATNAGGSDPETKTNYITVSAAPPPPVAAFTGTPTSGTAPLTVVFTDQSTNNPTSWSWDFGDGGTATTRNPSHVYAAAGSYSVSLTATDAGGSDPETKTNYITVTAPTPPPVAAFIGTPTSGVAPLTVAFAHQSTNNPTSWSWSFGDGGTATTQSPSHVYEAAGTYTVTLTATNASGSDSETKTNYITVTAPTPPPVAAFTGRPTSGVSPLTVTFTDQSTNNPTSWSWDLGDGGTATTQSPSHVYEAAGTYSVTLTATNAGGSDPETKTNYITVTAPPSPPPPVAAFIGTPRSGTTPLSVTFTDKSTNAPISWSWDFGDGSSSIERDPSHAYATVGTYSVQLTVSNPDGSDSETQREYITVTRLDPDIDVTPPARVTDLQGFPLGPEALQLRWTAVGDDGLDGQAARYSVRWSLEPITVDTWNTLDLLAAVPVPAQSGFPEGFDQSGLHAGEKYYFALVVLDEGGNASEMSNVAVVMLPDAIDTAPPNRPTGVLAVFGDERVTISWNPSPDPDVAGHRVYRRVADTSPALQAPEGLEGTNYYDRGVVPGETYGYSVTAIDRSGNESPTSSETWITIPVDQQVPLVLGIDYLKSSGAEVDLNRVRIRWSTRPGPDLVGFNVYRERLDSAKPDPGDRRSAGGAGSSGELIDPAGPMLRLTEEMLPGAGPHEFTESPLPAPGTYRYWVEAAGHSVARQLLNPIEVSIDRRVGTGLDLFPNPMVHDVTASFFLERSQQLRVEIYSASGRLIYRELQTSPDAGLQNWQWNGVQSDGREAASGTYFLIVSSGQSTHRGRIVVTR